MSLTVYSQPRESSNRYIITNGDTLMVFNKIEVRKISNIVIENKVLKERIDTCLIREEFTRNINLIQERRIQDLQRQFLLQKETTEFWKNGFNTADDEVERITEVSKKLNRASFRKGMLIGGGVTLIGISTLIILAN